MHRETNSGSEFVCLIYRDFIVSNNELTPHCSATKGGVKKNFEFYFTSFR